MDNIEERKGYKMTYKELLYLLYFQRYECFHTENHVVGKEMAELSRAVCADGTHAPQHSWYTWCQQENDFFFTFNT